VSVVALLIISVFVITIYRQVTDKEDALFSFSPQILSVAIGLIISLLFVERWKTLESRVNKLSEGPLDALKNIQDFVKKETEARFEYIESRAQTLSETVNSLVEKHPWLEVITKREIIVETDSCRGILRTCYSLLKENKVLHLFEYLELCSQKGISSDGSKKNTPLRGTADDFLELSYFCEVWLGDYYLSAQFLKRYIEQYPDSGHLLQHEYIRKLLRIGDLREVIRQVNNLKNRLRCTNRFYRTLLKINFFKPKSERFAWSAFNALALAEATYGNDKMAGWYLKYISSNKFYKIFQVRQLLFDLELQIQLGQFEVAKDLAESLNNVELHPFELSELSYIYAKMGDYDKASQFKDIIVSHHKEVFGNDERKVKTIIFNEINRWNSENNLNLNQKFENRTATMMREGISKQRSKDSDLER